jgi:hypothetical protein
MADQGFLAANFNINDWVDPAPLRDVLDELRQAKTTTLPYAAAPSNPRTQSHTVH